MSCVLKKPKKQLLVVPGKTGVAAEGLFADPRRPVPVFVLGLVEDLVLLTRDR